MDREGSGVTKSCDFASGNIEINDLSVKKYSLLPRHIRAVAHVKTAVSCRMRLLLKFMASSW